LKQQEDPETQYVLDMIQMGSPSKDKDNRQHSRSTLKAVKRKPVLHNDVRREDQQFDQVWEDTIHGRAAAEQEDLAEEQETYGVRGADYNDGRGNEIYPGSANIQLNSTGAFNKTQQSQRQSEHSYKSPNAELSQNSMN